jgi:hypothetical protein
MFADKSVPLQAAGLPARSAQEIVRGSQGQTSSGVRSLSEDRKCSHGKARHGGSMWENC